MEFIRHPIDGVIELRPKYFGDARGYFAETYRKSAWEQAGVFLEFVQENKSLSRAVGTIRGLHFQLPPFAQDKLVSCVRGAIYDVAVDIRRASRTFGQHVGVTLTAERGEQLLVPAGFAHGFCTIEPDTEVAYKVSSYYSAECDRGVLWSDPAIGIAWPVEPDAAQLSDKDRRAPLLADAPDLF
ncbi:dTDP-4-dehydrorhamnose 3,5-epimerase [Hansschlegelia sp. KR7-227]|uniref:dTDP-4-dehydrorhamnose 3,5-epimerase n=1 Tax=Hansschlegelia sp. KR7-227 TaxID=3400914 RepID=UPI003C03C012